MGHENPESLFDRFFDWNCCWAGVVVVRPRANHLARSSSNGLLSGNPRYHHRDSGYLAAADRNEFPVALLAGGSGARDGAQPAGVAERVCPP